MEACKYKLPLFIIHISLVAQVEKLKKQVSYTIHLEMIHRTGREV